MRNKVAIQTLATLVVLMAGFSWTESAEGQSAPKESAGKGQYRGAVPCTKECTRRRAELVKQIQNHNARLNVTTVCKTDYTPERRQKYHDEAEALRAKVRQLWSDCKGQDCKQWTVSPWPTSDPRVSTTGPCKEALKAEAERKVFQMQRELIDLNTTQKEWDRVCNGFGIWSPSVSAGVSIGFEAGVGVEMNAENVCKVFTTLSPQMVGAKEKSIVDAQEAAFRDPPSQDYLRVTQPRIERLSAPKGARSFEVSAYSAVNAQRSVAAFIRAYVDAFERYQGAEAAEHGQAMVRQARAMSNFATSAKTASGNAARSWHEFNRAMFAAVERWSRAQGLTGKQHRAATSADARTKALEALAKARASGRATEAETASAREGIALVLGERWPAFLEERRQELNRGPRIADGEFCEMLVQISRGVEELASLRLELPKQPDRGQ
jgi:hypothetical protein